MSGPIAQTAPTSNGQGGGTFTPAATPTAVAGSFGGPGASGFPGPGTPQILSARNNSGSNVRIPYARLVPMRGKDSHTVGDNEQIWASIPDLNLRNGLNGRMVGQEYDGLEQAELAWIYGRHKGAMAAMGKGVDRLQRLAYQGYMEAYFRAVFGRKVIDLNTLPICDQTTMALCGEFLQYDELLRGATVLSSVDVPFEIEANIVNAGKAFEPLQYRSREMNTVDQKLNVANTAPVNAGVRGLATGIFVMDSGPFLRGKVVDDDSVNVTDLRSRTPNGGVSVSHATPRNLGDQLAFDALYTHMQERTFFEWKPDGMVLSKLESPAGEPYSSMELDARQAQLFNIAVQGPAIAKTWTGDPKQAVMPLDRVFVAIVADVSTKLGGAPTSKVADLVEALRKFYVDATPDNRNRVRSTVANATPPATPAGNNGEYADAVEELFKAAASKGSGADASFAPAAAAAAAAAATTDPRTEMDKFFGVPTKDAAKLAEWRAAFENMAGQLRRGEIGAASCNMTNFRLKRVTSAYLAQYSNFVPGNSESRCGLRLGTKGAVPAAAGVTVTGEYIIGAWCIGTVLDNAASRSTIGSTVRVAPSSMAININVNIEWWSGDRLYRTYMDTDGTVMRRDQTVSTEVRQSRQAGTDVASAAMEELRPWLEEKPPAAAAAASAAAAAAPPAAPPALVT